ncbi:cysteine-rich DPF motif domain-containing protein 1-like isoform X1 [Limulus polyphemus]|uniref:Cysteine-rich DPF motif domain-containing protein 1 n=1 Tax=Limulus polyphemus TaxID=6850 RepID=A0ABM1S4B8_LIMPO|nr:cysteine-rich DPF motif domain-containing protein 1-like isoform X1 [Limulus polyphemus]
MEQATGDENNDENCCRKFTCYMCGMTETFHYFGKRPPFLKSILFLEDVYLAKDPFSPAGEGIFLLLGGHCSLCKNIVCQAEECSIYFSKRFCLSCAKDNSLQFPPELRKAIKMSST